MIKTPADLKEQVLEVIDNYHYETPEPGSTVGVPWSYEKTMAKVKEMRCFVVDPYVAEFLFHDTLEEIHADPQIRKKCWVVAEDDHYRLLYDNDSGEFVLAELMNGEWTTIGVRGDLVGTFLAR